MKPFKNQRGMIDIVLIVVIAVLIAGLGGYIYYRQQQANKVYDAAGSGATVAKHSPIAKATVNPASYAGWKSYTSPSEKFTFKYPPGWTLTSTPDTSGDILKEFVTLTAPNHFSLRYDVYKLSDGSFNCSGCLFKGVTQLSQANYGKALYMAVNNNSTINGNQSFQTLGISENTSLAQQQYKGWLNYPAKYSPGYVVRWAGEYTEPGNGEEQLIYMNYADFVNKPEVQQAMLVLESLKY